MRGKRGTLKNKNRPKSFLKLHLCFLICTHCLYMDLDGKKIATSNSPFQAFAWFIRTQNIFFFKFSWRMSFLDQCIVMNVETAICCRASPAQKLQGLRVVYSINFSRTTFFVFRGTHLVARFLCYWPLKKIWRKCAVCSCVKHLWILLWNRCIEIWIL